jgi:hypothetical protein
VILIDDVIRLLASVAAISEMAAREYLKEKPYHDIQKIRKMCLDGDVDGLSLIVDRLRTEANDHHAGQPPGKTDEGAAGSV